MSVYVLTPRFAWLLVGLIHTELWFPLTGHSQQPGRDNYRQIPDVKEEPFGPCCLVILQCKDVLLT